MPRKKGLERFGRNIVLLQMTENSIEKEAEAFVSEEKEVKNVKEAIAGAMDIVAEVFLMKQITVFVFVK